MVCCKAFVQCSGVGIDNGIRQNIICLLSIKNSQLCRWVALINNSGQSLLFYSHTFSSKTVEGRTWLPIKHIHIMKFCESFANSPLPLIHFIYSWFNTVKHKLPVFLNKEQGDSAVLRTPARYLSYQTFLPSSLHLSIITIYLLIVFYSDCKHLVHVHMNYKLFS